MSRSFMVPRLRFALPTPHSILKVTGVLSATWRVQWFFVLEPEDLVDEGCSMVRLAEWLSFDWVTSGFQVGTLYSSLPSTRPEVAPPETSSSPTPILRLMAAESMSAESTW